MKRALWIAATIVYAAGLIYLVFFARRRDEMQHRPSVTLVNFVPVINQIKTYQRLNPKDPREERDFFMNLTGNILLFLPLPVLLVAFGYRSPKHVFAAAVILSVSIEVLQYIFVVGVADVDDVILNVAGAYAGLCLLHSLPLRLRAAIC